MYLYTGTSRRRNFKQHEDYKMNKNTATTGSLSQKKLPVSSVPVSEEMIEQFMRLSASGLCSEFGAAEVLAQKCTPTKAAPLISWLNENVESMVLCAEGVEVSILEAVASCAQGVTRIEHAIQYVYHNALKQNLLFLYSLEQDKVA